MSERRPLVYIPGHGQSYYINSDNYTGSHNRVMHTFRQAGYEPHFYQPPWRQPDPHAWAKGAAKYATSIAKDKGVVFAGFSFGALTATLATNILEQSTETRVDRLVACSLSPFFGSEDVIRAHLNPDSVVHIISDELKAAFSKLTLPAINAPIQLYVGTLELPSIRDVHERALRQWPQAESIKPPVNMSFLLNHT